MFVSPERLFQIIGEQAVELLLVKAQLATSQQATADAAAEANRLRAEAAGKKCPDCGYAPGERPRAMPEPEVMPDAT